MNTLGELTASYREKKGMRQKFLAKQIGIDPTRLSRIESGKEKLSNLELIRRIVGVLELSKDQSDEYISVAGYNPDEIEDERETNVKQVGEAFFNGQKLPDKHIERNMPEPPPIGEIGAKQKLEEPIPAWRLKADGTIIYANLLAFWIWNALIERVLYPTRLIGQNVFSTFTDGSNIERIAMPRSINDFWYVKMYMLIIFETFMPRKLFRQVKDKIMKYPVLKLLYEYAYNHPEDEPVGKNYYTYNLVLVCGAKWVEAA